jgi:hypothetical protein
VKGRGTRFERVAIMLQETKMVGDGVLQGNRKAKGLQFERRIINKDFPSII